MPTIVGGNIVPLLPVADVGNGISDEQREMAHEPGTAQPTISEFWVRVRVDLRLVRLPPLRHLNKSRMADRKRCDMNAYKNGLQLLDRNNNKYVVG